MTLAGSSSRLVQAGATLMLTAFAGGALADDSAEPPEKKWNVMLGAGVQSRPEYPGSGTDEFRPVPVVNIRYGRYFLGGVPGGGTSVGGGLGAYLYEDKSWTLGAVLAVDIGEVRDESDDARLQGLGDIDGTIRAGFFASYQLTNWLALRGNALSDIGGKDQGLIASFDARRLISHIRGCTCPLDLE